MKRFVLNIIAFIPLLVILLHVRPLYLIYTGQYQETVAGDEVYLSIRKSKQKKKTKKLLLGDSVGNQMFSNKTNTDTINSLACNQAIGMVGQFFLLNNYLNAGNLVDTVYLVYSPFSFSNNLDQVYTYHYFLKPFYTSEYRPLFTETVNRQISKIPYRFFCRYPYILTSNWAPDFVSKDSTDWTFLSPVSVDYLKKMKELSYKFKFRLVIVAPPTRASKKSFIDGLDKRRIAKTDLEKEFESYFNNIIYLSEDEFVDPIHLKDPLKYTSYYRSKIIL